MKRFLLFFSYIGSGFRGLQRQTPRSLRVGSVPAVAEVIEGCIRNILELPETPILYTASRTDSGVHALRTAAHINLDLNGRHVDSLVESMNKYFADISVPISNPDFNIDAVNQVLPLFHGFRDFRTFMGSLGSLKRRAILEKDIITIRKLDSIEITPGRPFLSSPLDNNFDYWNFKCSSRSFLFKQVRRMVATLLRVGDGSLTYDQVKYMFDNPASSSWNNKCRTVPPYGLYLTDVVYNQEDLVEPVDDVEDVDKIKSTDLKTGPKDVVNLTINEKINLRLEKLKLQQSEVFSKMPTCKKLKS